MKEVNIISSVVGRDNVGKSVGSTAPSMGAYALKSELLALQSTFNDFLEGDDTDTVINRWKELEAFLNGISEDNTLSSILGDYIPIQGYTDILGEKNFTGGLKVNGSPIVYDADNKYWKLEGDLIVTGGVTMYANEGTYTPSTIMDAIAVDGTTISKDGGVLKVIGSVGGTTTMGSLTNVGSWADSVASQDRIMYQAANSSQWVAKNLSDLSVGGVTGDYLPLTGGTLSGALTVSNGNQWTPIKINRAEWGESTFVVDSSGLYISHTIDSVQAYLQLHPTNGFKFNGNTIWHAGNDGSGSGLNADLLDGKHYSDIINGNVASATKLQTARTIWGQSFNGTGNVDGSMRIIPNEGSYSEGIRIQPYNTWAAIMLLGTDATAAGQGTTDKSWGIFNNDGKFYINRNNSSGTSGYELCNIDGNWGVGTVNPRYKLSVVGGGAYYLNTQTISSNATNYDISKTFSLLCAEDNRFGLNAWINDDGSVSLQSSYNNQYSNQTYNININPLGGNVGIGTTNPYSKLHSVGDITVSVPSNNPTASINFMNTPSDFWQISGRYTGSEKGTFKTYYYNGSTWSTIVTLYNNGNMLVSGGITMYSDKRKKTILNHVELSLQQVANAPLIEHYYNSDEKKTTHVGSIAQYWAGLNDWFCKLDSEGYYTMEIQNAALASAISVARELVKFETETDIRIRLLEEENKRLKEEVEQLKWHIA